MVLVHVPNAIAKQASACQIFYATIQNQCLQTGAGVIDVIMGDTNQSSADFTQKVVSTTLKTNFVNAHSGANIEPYDTYQRSFKGTNATGTKKYDIAVYNADTVQLKNVIYLTQFIATESGAAAVTDHMGIGVHVEK